MTNYWFLGLLALLTTVLIGIHANWLLGGTALLILLWIYAIAVLLFKRPTVPSLSFGFVPGDAENLDKLYHRAMQYCNEIIDHYQNTRYTTRRYYILAQILTATLSGLTPILVLVDRNSDLKQMMPPSFRAGLTWAVLIMPGLAAVLATTSTVFNFQEEWIQAKKTAESLEAVREEFLVGASPQYRITARDPETKLLQRKQALENFIIKVNELHLKQVDLWASSQRSAAQQDALQVQVESLGARDRSPAFPSQTSKALPAETTQTQSPPPSEAGTERSQTMASNFSGDGLSEDNLRVRPDQELHLAPPQDTSLTDETLEEDGPFII